MTATRAPWIGLDLENGRYHVLGLLGEGGMASIFKATDRQKNQEVVLKVPKPALLADPEFVHRFAREIRTLVELKHHSVVAVYGFGRHDGVPFAVLEYLSGGTLADQPKNSKPRELGAWLPDVATALDHIHKAGYVHRDVKPGNILFDEKGRARLADFGIIKSINEKASQQTMALTESGVTVGTPEYMAPELAKGHSFDGKVDQYALAVTVYERISGRRPIEGGTGPVILVKQIREKPKPLDEVAEVSSVLAEVVGKALAKDPKNRYATCFEFARAVMNPSRPTPAATKVPTNTRSVASVRTPLAYESAPQRSSWVLPAAIGGGVLALGMFAILGWFLLRPGASTAAPNTNKIPLGDAPMATAADMAFTFNPITSAKATAGKTNNITVTVKRATEWSGPISLAMQSEQVGVSPLGGATIAGGSDTAMLAYRLQPTVTTASIKIIGKAGDVVQEVTIPLDITVPRYSVIQPDDVNLAANEEKLVTIAIVREGWDEDIMLAAESPQGVTIPSVLRIAAGSNELSLRVRPIGKAHSGPVRLLDMRTREEKARFNVTVAEATKGKAKAPVPVEEKTWSARLPSAISIIAFNPRDAQSLVVWDQSHMSIWEIGSRSPSINKLLESVPMCGTLKPNGKQILTATKSRIYLHDLQGKETSGPNRYPIVGLYYDTSQPAPMEYFWSPSGLLDRKLERIQPVTVKATAIKHSTSDSDVKLTELDGKVTMSSKKKITFATPKADDFKVTFTAPKPDDFAVSHDGRWVAIAARGKVLLYDTNAADPAAPIWEKDVPNVAAVAVSPNGKTLAVGIGKELRLVNVEDKE